MPAKKIIFVTGTDTGVGKTLVAALLLHHLRQGAGRALAMKPFCSGGLGDVRLLQSLQPGELPDSEMNPYYFSEPVAPLVAASPQRKPIRLPEVVRRIERIADSCDHLVVEGSGGVLVPLGLDFTVADLICELDCRVVVAARNQLGTINHTLLTTFALESIRIRPQDLAVVLMGSRKKDLSSETNEAVIAGLLKHLTVTAIPYLGANAASARGVRKNYPKVKNILATLAGADF